MTNHDPDLFRREALDSLKPSTARYAGLRPVPARLTLAFWLLLVGCTIAGLAGWQFVSLLLEGLFGTTGGGANG